MLSASLLPALEHALASLQYGEIHLVVHDGQVVQIERVERIRLTGSSGGPQHTSRPSTRMHPENG